MEFITGLPTFEGKDVIFVIIQQLTKYAHFVGISSKSKSSQVDDSYVKNIFKLHGFPVVENDAPTTLCALETLLSTMVNLDKSSSTPTDADLGLDIEEKEDGGESNGNGGDLDDSNMLYYERAVRFFHPRL